MLKDVIVSIHGNMENRRSRYRKRVGPTLRVRLTTTMILENSTLYSLQFEVIGPNTHFILLAYFMRVLTYGSAAIKSSPTPR